MSRSPSGRVKSSPSIRATAAWAENKFANELTPVSVPQKRGDPVLFAKDEGFRPDASMESLGALKPIEKGGIVTPGNASQQNDAAAACLVGGDFNDWRSLLVPFLTQGMNFRSATDSATGRPLLTYPSFFPRGPLDRIFFRGPLVLDSAYRCRQRLSRLASDHLPIVADFETR